jgi:hypothetical protein
MSDNVFNINDKVLNLKAQFQICRMAKNSVCHYCKIRQSISVKELEDFRDFIRRSDQSIKKLLSLQAFVVN